ncbi:aminoglycoside 6-adenylyltransferase, partial [Legionella pneumophila]
MNGSRASPSAKKDIFQDYDIVYLVTEIESFVHDKNWINYLLTLILFSAPFFMTMMLMRRFSGL